MKVRNLSGRWLISTACIAFGVCAATTMSPGVARAAEASSEPAHYIRITSKSSLIHLGSLDSFDITEGGTKAAELLYDYLENAKLDSARSAKEIYGKIIPSENFGGEYTALEWLCEFFLAPKAEHDKLLADRVVAQWFKYLSNENFAPLKEYLKQKYHLLEWKHRKTPKMAAQFRFLEDFILFNNPRRERWEKTSKIMEVLGLKRGEVVADVGCGPGFFSFKFADLVGEDGMVYAIDTNTQHVDYVTKLVRAFGLKHVQAIEPTAAGLKLNRKADLAYVCSLYHNIYALSGLDERDKFVEGIKSVLKPDGRLVVIDNDLVEDKTLPYHGPYIARDLIINQLWYYGFRLVSAHQFIPQRYVLVFQLQPGAVPAAATRPASVPADAIPILSKTSLVRGLKTTTFPGFTEDGRKAARIFLAALETKDPQKVRAALAAYMALIPKERFGDEYTAFQWFCEYLLASANARKSMLADWPVREYFNRLAADDFQIMKKYVHYKYFLDEVLDDDDLARTGKKVELKHRPLDELQIPEASGLTLDQINEWGDFIAFNNPHRDGWEKTGKMLDFLHLKPGDQVADVGSGPGYYTFKFSKLVGSKGRVYAVETVQSHLDYIQTLCEKQKIKNVQTILTRDNDTKLPPASVDVAYLCSMYHAMYIGTLEYVKDGFINSLKRSLKKGGRLVIADNAIIENTKDIPYYGPGIAKELVIQQLKHYGFRLVDSAQFIPQRYVLIFEME